MESLFLPTLWKFCNQTPSLALKVRFPGDSQPFRLIPWLGSLMWGSERSQPSLVLFFSSVWDAHPTGMGFDFIVIAPLLLSCCSFSFVFGHEHLFFWWVPESSCQWFFYSKLWFWCSHRKCVHFLLLHHLEPISPTDTLFYSWIYQYFCCADFFLSFFSILKIVSISSYAFLILFMI